jgi:hypothetical protein
MTFRRYFGAVIITLNISLVSDLFAAGEPPNIYIDKGACPFECCTYGQWTAREKVVLFDQINGKKLTREIIKDEQVTAITGEVHSRPIKAHVTHVDKSDEEQGIHVGDIIYILHYLGEGAVKFWHAGEAKDGSMDLVYEIDNSSESGGQPPVWWVKIRTKDGLVAWVKNPDRKSKGADLLPFQGTDGCG